MSSEKNTTSPDVRQVETNQIELLNTLIQTLLQLLGPSAPAVMPGALYTREQLERNIGHGNTTTTLWLDSGLKRYRPGTRSDLFMGDEVIAFVKANPNLHRPDNYKAKINQRKKGRGT